MEERARTRLTHAEGRRFALPVGVAFLLLAGLLWWRDQQVLAAIAGGLAGLLVLAGLLIPNRLGPVERGWMAFAVAISRVTTPIFMAIVYFFVMTPIGFVRRMAGGNPIVHEPVDDSYWTTRSREDRQGDLERQF